MTGSIGATERSKNESHWYLGQTKSILSLGRQPWKSRGWEIFNKMMLFISRECEITKTILSLHSNIHSSNPIFWRCYFPLTPDVHPPVCQSVCHVRRTITYRRGNKILERGAIFLGTRGTRNRKWRERKISTLIFFCTPYLFCPLPLE